MRDKGKIKDQVINELTETPQRVAELEKLKSERKKAEEELRSQSELLKDIISNIPHSVFWKDENLVYLGCNDNFAKEAGREKSEDIIGKTDFDLPWKKEESDFYRKIDREILKKNKPISNIEEPVHKADGIGATLLTSKVPLRDADGKAIGVLGIYVDITERKKAEEMLQEQKLALEQKNVALREVIAQIEVEKNKVKEDIAANVKEVLLPILEKLKTKKAPYRYVDLLKRHLEEITSSFGRKMAGKSVKLTSREIEICNMIKGGLTSKEISDFLNTSCQTIEKHRKNIRHKLGITNKSVNLSSYLHKL